MLGCKSLGKAVQKIRLEHSTAKTRWISREEFNGFVKVITSERKAILLPEGAPKYIVHPDWALPHYWDQLMVALACFYFWELPFAIAFDAGHRLRATLP